MNKLVEAIEKSTLEIFKGDTQPEIIGKFSFDMDFIGFSGHFPGYPILPAVLQVLLGQLLVEKQNGGSIQVTRIVKAKFLSEIRPDDLITVQCTDAPTDETRRCRVTISCGERSVSSFNMDYILK